MKVKVINDKCIGCGNCVALTESQIFDFNDDGLAETIIDKIPENMKETVNDAIIQCPTEAIIEINAETIIDKIPENMKETVNDAIIQCPTEAIIEINEEEKSIETK